MSEMSNSRVPLVIVIVLGALSTSSKSGDPVKADKAIIDSMRGKQAGELRDDNELKMPFVWCLLGTVPMEQPEYDEGRRVRSVTPVDVLLTSGYWLGRYEVTQAEWKRIMATEPWKGENWTKEGDDVAATYVNWDEAMDFCRRFTNRERKAGRLTDGWEYTLPTEAQWERGCRAATDTKFSFGDDETKLGEYAWVRANSMDVDESYAHPVGRKKPNPWGLHDMHGNAYEWCRDWYSQTLPGGRDPEVTEGNPRTEGDYRILRGGGWTVGAVFCRSASRHANSPSFRFHGSGFRVACSPVRPPKVKE